jgi:tRNA (adenine57-N1/adenine58-N1)-methyltransferase
VTRPVTAGRAGGPGRAGRPFAEGERVMLVDRRKRHYLVTLAAGKEFHTHAGVVRHDELIGLPEGATARSTRAERYVALRPTLEDTILLMPRGAQVIYPKDLGAIVLLADIGPGVRVLESGVGSGALSIALLRTGAVVTGYELREDFANRARKNVAEFLGAAVGDRYQVELRDCYEGIDVEVDRVVLDLPEPWRVVRHAEAAMTTGGTLLAYTPSIVQAARTREVLATGPWAEVRTLEVLHRTWHVDGDAVRPDHRMVAHTGFLTYGRLVAGDPTGRWAADETGYAGSSPSAP